LKKLIPAAAVALFVIPQYAFAGFPFWPPDRGHDHISGAQLTGLGGIAAVVVGLAAYLILRRKSAREN
jgi:hypothetical protein